MRLLLQRASRAEVRVGGEVVGSIGPGLVALAGFRSGDADAALAATLRKALNLRVFADADGKMNRSLLDVGGGLLIVSQFTLYADCRKGRRPSYIGAAPPDEAERLYERFVAMARAEGLEVATGRFGAMMEVELVNDGPVTIWLDSDDIASGGVSR